MVKDDKINVQIKLSKDFHTEFKEWAEWRKTTIQSAGLEAFEMWIYVQKYVGNFLEKGKEDISHEISEAFHKAIDDWTASHREAKFNDDPLISIMGSFKGDPDLSKIHDRHYETSPENQESSKKEED